MMNFILGIAALCGIADFVIERIPEVPATRIITSASAQTPKTPPQHKKSPTEQKFSGVLKFAFDCEFALTDRFKPR